MIVGLICARSGSRGLPGKNFGYMHGKPLLAWSLDVARRSQTLSDIRVVTDQCPPELAHWHMEEPAYLTAADVPKWNVWRWAIDELKADAVVDIDITRPMRKPGHIDDCVSTFDMFRPDVVMGISPSPKSPYFDILEHDADGCLSLSKPHPFTVRQKAPQTYAHAGIYVVGREALEGFDALFAPGQKIRGVVLPPENAMDIDSRNDWLAVEAVMKEWLRHARSP